MSTPLLQAFLRGMIEKRGRLAAPPNSNRNAADLLTRMDDVHPFEVSEVSRAAQDMASLIIRGQHVDFSETFLPARQTWIEYKGNGYRSAFFLEDVATGIFATGVRQGIPDALISDPSFAHTERDDIEVFARRELLPRMSCVSSEFYFNGMRDSQKWGAAAVFVYLSLINTPKIVGRRQHMPHRGLERRLLKNRANIGKFPLHAWTEIKLSIAPPKDASGEPSTEAHLTGERALHFCRAHLRVKMGRVEYVRGHWRGDPSLGIKRSRYRVTA